MQLQSYQSEFILPSAKNQDWTNEFDYTLLQPKFQPDTWVKLLELPSTYSFDEALLLCQLSADRWLAWIPDHGEAELNTDRICPLN